MPTGQKGIDGPEERFMPVAARRIDLNQSEGQFV
jgi:hypothetical protein